MINGVALLGSLILVWFCRVAAVEDKELEVLRIIGEICLLAVTYIALIVIGKYV